MTTHDRTATLVAVDEAWFGSWQGPSILRIADGTVEFDGPAHDSDRGLPRIAGTVLSPFTDSHVHLGLIEPERLAAGGISRCLDLGWSPAVAREWPARAAESPDWPDVAIAGGLLGPTGGYPSRSGWAPADAAIAVDDLAAARDAVARERDLGASVIKITLNSEVGPVWPDALLADVVATAHDLGLPVAAHVQGRGQAARALQAEVDLFAHAPFSEKLNDTLIERLALATGWISTLDIHGYGAGGRTFRVAVDNVRRFHEAGGAVRYGTDLGNGPLPVGLNGRELEALRAAGLDDDALLGALVPPAEPAPSRRVSFVPAGRPEPGADFVEWLTRVASVTAADLLASAR